MFMIWLPIIAIVAVIVVYLISQIQEKNKGEINKGHAKASSFENESIRVQKETKEKMNRAKESGVPDLITTVYHNYIKLYPAWLADERKRDSVYPLVSELVKLDTNRVKFCLKGKQYMLSFNEKLIGLPDRKQKQGFLELYENEKKMLALNMTWEFGKYDDEWRAFGIETFVEGDWVNDFRELERFHQEKLAQWLKEKKDAPEREEQN